MTKKPMESVLLAAIVAFAAMQPAAGGVKGAAIAFEPITIDREGFYCQGGKRIFPFGMYQVRPEDMAEVKAHGFDVVHNYQWERESDDDECRAYLDACAGNGLRAFIGFPRKNIIAGDKARIAARVEKLKCHPGLFCWYLFDEPALKKQYVAPERLTEFADMIRQLDKNHPVVVTTWDKGMCDYRRSWDVHWSQAYGTEPAYVAHLVDQHREYIKTASPISLLLNSFDVKQAKALDRKEIAKLDQATFSHDYGFLKACAFLGIVKRCNGIFWWFFARGDYRYVTVGNHAGAWTNLTGVVKELSAYRSLALAEGEVCTGIATPNGAAVKKYYDPRVEWWAKTVDGKTTVIAVNTAERPLEVKLDLPGMGKRAYRFDRYEVKVIKDDSARLQKMIDAAPGGTVAVTSGVYEIATPLAITNGASVRMDPSAVLRAVGEMDYVVRIDNMMRAGYNLSFTGGIIDGNGLASCMALDGYMHFTLRDTAFFNGRKFGLRVNGYGFGYELVADNLYFKCMKSGLRGNVALYSSGGDSHYNDCTVTDYTVGLRFDKGGGNRITRCHVWGGLVPPLEKGGVPEMLIDSVCFWIDKSHNNTLRDCYADTAKVGYRIDGCDIRLDGCWFENNPIFKLNDLTVIEHLGGNLAVTASHFNRRDDRVEIYRPTSPFARVSWGDNTYANFTSGPGSANYEADARFQVAQACNSVDEWELMPADQQRFTFKAGAFARQPKYESRKIFVPVKAMKAKFPDMGGGSALVLKARSLAEPAEKFEIAWVQRDGKTWGVDVPIGTELREVKIPFSGFRSYHGCWSGVSPIANGELPDLRELDHLVISYGAWLCADAVNRPHEFEIVSVTVRTTHKKHDAICALEGVDKNGDRQDGEV